MRVGEGTGTHAGAWFVEADHAGGAARVPRRSRSRFAGEQEGSARVVVVSSLFLVLFAAMLLIGGHTAIEPLLRDAMAAREAKGAGDVFYAMPDGIFCRHLSFDNATADVTEGAIERCASDIAKDPAHAARGFSWPVKK